MPKSEEWLNHSRIREDKWFRVYWSLRSWLAAASGLGIPGDNLIDSVLLNQEPFERQIKEDATQYSSFDPPFTYPPEFVNEGRRLAVAVSEAVAERQPKVNVYQAAVCAMTTWGYSGNHIHDTHLFRGERDVELSARQFTPSIFRFEPDAEELALRRRRIDVAAGRFREKFPERTDSDEEVLAILQHHGVKTWLLDVTTSVYVALYFASLGTNGVGIVYAYSKKKLRDMLKLSKELVPAIRSIKPPFVPRIDRQYAVFLDGGHGWMSRHAVVEVIQFKQSPGMHFEDAGLGVSTRRLVSKEDAYSDWFKNNLSSMFATEEHENSNSVEDAELITASRPKSFREAMQTARVLDTKMPTPPSWPPSLDLLQLFAHRILQNGVLLSEPEGAATKILARFHQLMCEYLERNFLVTSPHTFVDAVECYGRTASFDESFSRYFAYVRTEEDGRLFFYARSRIRAEYPTGSS